MRDINELTSNLEPNERQCLVTILKGTCRFLRERNITKDYMARHIESSKVRARQRKLLYGTDKSDLDSQDIMTKMLALFMRYRRNNKTPLDEAWCSFIDCVAYSPHTTSKTVGMANEFKHYLTNTYHMLTAPRAHSRNDMLLSEQLVSVHPRNLNTW